MTKIKCEACGAPLELEIGQTVGYCRFCGSKYDASAVTKDDKDIELAKINIQAYKETEAAKQEHELTKIREEREWQQKQQLIQEEKEKKEAFKKGKFKKALVFFLVFFSFWTALALITSHIISTVIGFIQLALVIFSWLTASQSVKIKIPGIHIISFIAALVLIIPFTKAANFGSSSSNEKKYEAFEWENIVFCDILPEPSSNMGYIQYNSKSMLEIDISNISSNDYQAYKNKCMENGYDIVETDSGWYFTAFNKEGYELNLSHSDNKKELSIRLEAPMEMEEIKWPESIVGKMLPTPVSKVGKFSYEYEDNFFVYVGETSLDDFKDYVQKCSDNGFTVDYRNGDDFYYADNQDGYSLSLNYKVNNIMTIQISPPNKEISSTVDETATEMTILEETESETTHTSITANTESYVTEDIAQPSISSDIRPEVKEAIDSYEAFYDEYIAFMKKYQSADSSDLLGMMTDYLKMIEKESEMADKMDALENDMNDAEFAYYIEVYSRVMQKNLSLV